MLRIKIIGLFCFCFTLVFCQKENRRSFYFENNSSELTMEQMLSVREWIDSIKSNDRILLLGYANKLGDESKNLSLSQKRAEAIKAYLIENKIQDANIELRFFGEKFALNDPSSIIESRRVDCVISENNSEMDNPFQFKEEPQIFQIDASADTTIICKKGTKIFIKAGILVNTTTGEVPEKATIQVSEYLSKSDFVERGLTTRSDGRVLESGGMIQVDAMENNQELSIKRGKDIKISFPCKDCSVGMTTFIGEKKGTEINWKETGIKPKKVESRKTKPVFAEGNESLSHFIRQTKKYPIKAFEKNIEGTVVIKFIIDVNGNILEPKIVKTVEKTIDEEAMRVVEKMPKWTPAMLDAEPIEYIYTLSVDFHINKEPFGKSQITSIGGGSDFEYVEDKRMDSARRADEYNELLARKKEMEAVVDYGYYIVSTTKLGWINCDRIDARPTTNFIVDANTIENAKIYVIMKNQKSVFSNEYRVNSLFNFRQITDDIDVYVLAVKSEKGQMYVALHEANTAMKFLTVENYKESSVVELKKIVEQLKLN